MSVSSVLSKIDSLSVDSQIKELAVTLNKYREEAHVIHNRYNQMIWLIERGQSPYFIPYANIKEPKWLLLEGYMARAERLKDGTMDWERVLDQQAQDLRSVLLQEDKGKVKFDDIDGLIFCISSLVRPAPGNIRLGLTQRMARNTISRGIVR